MGPKYKGEGGESVQQTAATRKVTPLRTRKSRYSFLRKPKFWVRITILILAISLLVVFIRQEVVLSQLSSTQQNLEGQIGQAQQTVEQLQRLNEYASSEQAIENAARDTLGMVKEGEILFQSKATQSPQASTAVATQSPQQAQQPQATPADEPRE